MVSKEQALLDVLNVAAERGYHLNESELHLVLEVCGVHTGGQLKNILSQIRVAQAIMTECIENTKRDLERVEQRSSVFAGIETHIKHMLKLGDFELPQE